MTKYTLSTLRTALTRIEAGDSQFFEDLYEKVILRKGLEPDEVDTLFRIMNYFWVYGDQDVQKMTYYIALNYGLSTGDFEVLDHFANSLRYYPVVKLIEAAGGTAFKNTIDTELNTILSDSLAESFKDGYYRSEQQYRLSRTVREASDLIVVAPTSYGKSHLMVRKAIEEYAGGSNVCIIVPTKSLMSQTVSIVSSIKGDRSDVLTHPDMYVEKYREQPFIAVLTQERLIALLARYPSLAFNYIFVDESHNLFKDEDRSLTLTRAIIIAKKRAGGVATDFFSPFIAEPQTSLNFVGDVVTNQSTVSVTEYMKIPRYYLWNQGDGEISLFDQFTNRYYGTGETSENYYDLILTNGSDKNIIYMNKPSEVEGFADALASKIQDVDFSPESKVIIDDICDALSKYVHRSYNLIKLLKRGVVLSHGKMPDIIKEYVEFLYRTVPEIRFIVTTSTLLEGVNVPASKLFLMNYNKGLGSLDVPDFKNLSGRVGRYNVLFNLENPKLELLTPEIYMIKNTEYMASNANPVEYLSSHAKEGINVKDEVENPLLTAYRGEDKESRLVIESSMIANIDKTRASEYTTISNTSPQLALTDLGASCYVHNLKIFDVVRYEQSISNKIVSLAGTFSVHDAETLLNVIEAVFLRTTYYEGLKVDKHKYGNWAYLLYTQPYIKTIYQRIIDQKVSTEASFSSLIARSVLNWRDNIGTPAYVGDIGNCDSSGASSSGWNKYVIFSNQTRNLMPSYAAALAKENLDNIDHYIVPFLEVLNDFSIVEESFYKRIKYGTDDDFMIALIRSGLDFSLAKIIAENDDMKQLIAIVQESPVCSDKDALVDLMSANNVSLMYINAVRELL
ncbi:MAG: DEAD/DEAH box helicase [Candidatus Saccharimonas sp.]